MWSEQYERKKLFDIAEDARLQISAGVALLETSKLVEWNCKAEKFNAANSDDFEQALKEFDPVFGRVICWIIFSAGAEFLAKGVCLLYKVEIRKPNCVPAFPPQGGDITSWAKHNQKRTKRTEPVINFGQIRSLYNGHLQSLCEKVKAQPAEKNRLLAAYELLGTTIRNRDAHAYVPNKRESHHYLVRELFICCLNDLVSWAAQVPGTDLNTWRKEAEQFIFELHQKGSQTIDPSICEEVAIRKKRRQTKMKAD